MNKKVIRYIAVVILAICCFSIPTKVTNATAINGEVSTALNEFFKREEVIRNDVYFYGSNVYVTTNKKGDTKDITNNLKYTLAKIENAEKDLDVYLKKYKGNSVEGRYLSATSVILGYYKNAVYELLLYIDETNEDKRFEELDRYFFNRYTGKSTADWLRTITAISN